MQKKKNHLEGNGNTVLMVDDDDDDDDDAYHKNVILFVERVARWRE